jgi:type VI secretion system protein ImpC
MPKPFDFGSVAIDVTPQTQKAALVVDPETPFRILILGDFSGRANRNVTERIGSRRPVPIDRDNFDQVLARLSPSLRLAVAEGQQIEFRFAALDDFHPDHLLARVAGLRALWQMRKALEDPATFRAAAARLQPAAEPPAERPTPPPVLDLAGGSLLDQVIAGSEGEAPGRPQRSHDPLAAYIAAVVKPHLVPKPDPKQTEMVAQFDAAIAGHLRAILHHREFQALEAAWRGLYFLAQEVETNSQLKIYLLDVSLAELAADFGSADDLKATALYRLLVEETVRTPGAAPWAVIGGNYQFDHGLVNIELLCRMALLASQAGAPFLAAASPRVIGCPDFGSSPDPAEWKPDNTANWEFLRSFPEASWLGLTLPRFLLRLPYGKGGSSVDFMPFEEMAPAPRHDDYLWGNGMFAAMLLIARAFSEWGWAGRPGLLQDLDGMPVHIYEKDGEPCMKPCAEAWITETAAERIIENGLMPLLSFKDQNRIRVAGFRSVAKPPRPLEGRWQQ